MKKILHKILKTICLAFSRSLNEMTSIATALFTSSRTVSMLIGKTVTSRLINPALLSAMAFMLTMLTVKNIISIIFEENTNEIQIHSAVSQ